jgi:hypothetical protein
MRKLKSGTTWEVSARAQGQFPVVLDEAKKMKRVIRSANLGVLLPPKNVASDVQGNAGAQGRGVQPQSATVTVDAARARLAQDVIADRPLDEAAKDIATAWKRLHAAAPATK